MSGNHFGEYEEGNNTSETGRLVFEGFGTTHVSRKGDKMSSFFVGEKGRKLLMKKGMGRQRLTGCAAGVWYLCRHRTKEHA